MSAAGSHVMNDAEIERLRARNLNKITARALDACAQQSADGDMELEILLNGPHAKPVALAILDHPAATQNAVKRGVRLWLPFDTEGHLLYELVTDRSFTGVKRVKNLLDAGWDPNKTMPGTERTALMQVCNSWNDASRDLVALLLASGADVQAKSIGGQTALDYAPVPMRNFIHAFMMDMDQDTTNRTGRRSKVH